MSRTGLFDHLVPSASAAAAGEPARVSRSRTGLFDHLVPQREERAPTLGESFGRGVDQMQGMLYGGVEAIGEATGIEGVERFGEEGRIRNEGEAAQYPAARRALEVDSVGDGFAYAGDVLASQAPMMALSLAGAAAGAGIGSLLGPVGTAVGGVAGAFLPSALMSAGEVQGEIKGRDPNVEAPGVALGAGAAIGALDAILPGTLGTALVRRFGRGAAERIARQALLTRVPVGIGQGAVVEGMTEGLQELITIGSGAFATDQEMGEDTIERVTEGVIAGALFGGVVGGGAAVVPGRQQAQDDAPPADADPSPLDEQAPPRPGLRRGAWDPEPSPIVAPAPQAAPRRTLLEEDPALVEDAAILLGFNENPQGILTMNRAERADMVRQAREAGTAPVPLDEVLRRIPELAAETNNRARPDRRSLVRGQWEADTERLDSPRLSGADRASPIRNDLIDDGLAVVRGERDPLPPLPETRTSGTATARAEQTASVRQGDGPTDMQVSDEVRRIMALEAEARRRREAREASATSIVTDAPAMPAPRPAPAPVDLARPGRPVSTPAPPPARTDAPVRLEAGQSITLSPTARPERQRVPDLPADAPRVDITRPARAPALSTTQAQGTEFPNTVPQASPAPATAQAPAAQNLPPLRDPRPNREITPAEKLASFERQRDLLARVGADFDRGVPVDTLSQEENEYLRSPGNYLAQPRGDRVRLTRKGIDELRDLEVAVERWRAVVEGSSPQTEAMPAVDESTPPQREASVAEAAPAAIATRPIADVWSGLSLDQRKAAVSRAGVDASHARKRVWAGIPQSARLRLEPALRPRRGEVGMMLANGETVTTNTGRETTPFPNPQKRNSSQAVDRWLLQNALDEARSRGDAFNARQFEANLARPSQADKDSAEAYLFDPDFVFDVPRPIIRPLAAPAASPSPAPQAAPVAEAPPTPPSDRPAPNYLVSDARREELRKRLKDKLRNQVSAGIDPEIIAIGAELTVASIERGVRRFMDVAAELSRDLEMSLRELRPYLRSWYNGARDMMEDGGMSTEGMDNADAVRDALSDIDALIAREQAAPATPAAASSAPSQDGDAPGRLSRDQLDNLRGVFQQALLDGERFANINRARSLAAETLGLDRRITSDDPLAKVVEEQMEAAIVRVARQIARGPESVQAKYDRLVDLYSRQPLLSTRTSTSVEQQAYSTPAPLAYVASRLAGIDETVSVYEPSAGNGMLLIEARPTNVIANELNPDRRANLEPQGFRVTGNDAAEAAQAASIRNSEPVDRVIANPPFGKVRREDNQGNKVWNVEGIGTPEIDHAISLQALSAMREDGRAVLIIGGKQGDTDARREGYRADRVRAFFKTLYDKYNVVDHFTVDGRLYERQGAGWPVDVIVIDGRGKSALSYPMREPPPVLASWDEVRSKLDDRVDTAEQSVRPGERAFAPPAVEGADAAGLPVRPGRPDRQDGGEGGRAPGSRASGGRRGARAAEPAADPVDGNRGTVDGEQRVPVGSVGDAGIPGPARAGDRRPAGAGGARSGDAGGVSGTPVPRQRVERDNTEAETNFQVRYAPTSNARFAVGTLVPRNMQTAMTRALSTLSDRVGDIDTFVAARLGYSIDEMLGTEARPGYFSAEQVDALALAIDNVERGGAFIIGDQTGVGKGRFVAAMLRYALQNDRQPVFVTKDPGLYADMVRDLRDIGMRDIDSRVFISNVDIRGDKAIPLSDDASDRLSALNPTKHKLAIERMSATGRLPDGYDMLFTTYSQMQLVAKQETPRRRALRAIAPRSMFVLDESHEAGGSESRAIGEDGTPIPTRADFVRELLREAQGVVYSSATYAKNPTVMSLYFKTDLSQAVDNIDDLGETISSGGVPLQQVIANMLVEAGQYARRERSYDGVEIQMDQLPTDKVAADNAAAALRDIFSLDVSYMENVRNNYIEEQKSEGMAGATDGAVGENSASGVGFAQVMHNVVSQMLLALKAPAVVDKAIALARAGEKPIIALSNTNESILKDYIDETGVRSGQNVDITFNAILERYLRRLRRITLKKPDKSKVHVYLSDADIREFGGDDALAEYQRIEQQVRSIDLSGLPASPVDYILDRLNAAGVKADEITGRGVTLRGGRLTMREASPAEKKKAMNAYNAGRLDALVINKSGSTGFSMHATDKKGNDGKQRHMIVLQPDPNIDVFMQMLGRIHRTGQIRLPKYTLGVSDLAVEKRLAAVLMRKLSSLNANTTASKRSAVSLDSVDFMNKYGDEVVADYLRENPRIAQMTSTFPGTSNDGIAAQFTGRLAIMPADQVAQIYEEIEANYTEYVDSLDRMGLNALEAKTLDLDARTIETSELVPPKEGDGPFAEAATVETVDVRLLGKPFTTAELNDEIQRAMDGKSQADYIDEQRAALDAKFPEYVSGLQQGLERAQAALAEARTFKQKDKAQASIDGWTRAIAEAESRLEAIKARLLEYQPSTMLQLTVREGESQNTVYAVSLGTDVGKVKANPTAASQIMVRFAIADASREVRVPLSKLMGEDPRYSTQSTTREEVVAAFERGGQEARETRQIITGNLVSGFAQFKKGQITIFTDAEGNTRQGILMPREFDTARELERLPVKFQNAEQIARFLSEEPTGRMVKSEDGVVALTFDGIVYRVAVNTRGGKPYYLLKAVRDIIGDFQQRRGAKVYEQTMTARDFPRVVGAYIDNLGTTFLTTTSKDEARTIVSPQAGRSEASPAPADLPAVRLSQAEMDEVTEIVRRVAGIDPTFSETVSVDGESALGSYTPREGAQDVIAIARQASMPGARTAYHEAFHRVQTWFANDGERATLTAARDTLRRIVARDGVRSSSAAAMSAREIEAEAYAIYETQTTSGRAPVLMPASVRAVFDRMSRLVRRVANWLAGRGYQTWEDVFERASRGDMARRAPRATPITAGNTEARRRRNTPNEPFETFDDRSTREIMRMFGSVEQIQRAENWGDFITASRRALQDRFIDIKRQQRAIERADGGARLSVSQDTYGAIERYIGKVGTFLQEYYEGDVKAITNLMRSNGLTQEQVDDYLIALHAEERNEQIAKVRETLEPDSDFVRAATDPDVVGGSGMSANEARRIIREVEAGPNAAAFKTIARGVRKILDRRLERLVAAGVISDAQATAMGETYRNYVPLRGFEDDDGPMNLGIGRGFDARGNERRATGRTTRANSPLATSLAMGAQGILRAEKNKVGQTFLRLVENNPNPNVWSVNRGERVPRVESRLVRDPETGLLVPRDVVVERTQPPSRIADNVMIVKVGGNDVAITIEDRNIARAMKNLDPEQMNVAVAALNRVTRVLAALNTSWNVEWFVANLARDIQTAGIQISDEGIKGLGRKMLANWPRALRGAFEHLRGKHDSEWAQIAQDFERQGGRVSYIEFRSVEDFKDLIGREVSEGSIKRMLRMGPERFLNGIEVFTSTGENAIRIAAYKAALDAGMSKPRAASMARNLTVDFNKKGTLGPTINAMFMFFNAAVQGNVRLVQSIMRSKFTRRALGGLIAIGFLEALLGAGDDDEYEKVEPWVRERNFVLMLEPLGLGEAGSYIKIPMPYGFNVFKTMGTEIGRSTLIGTDPTEAAANVFKAAINSFNPIGGQDFVAMTTPTVLDPVLDIARNENFFRSQIAPDYPNDRRPPSEQYFPNVNPAFRALTAWLNNTTGGNEFREGAISINPEHIEHLFTSYLGGTGRLVSNTIASFQNAAAGRLEPERTPFLRQVYGQTIGEMPTWRAYRGLREDALALEYEAKELFEAGRGGEAREALNRDQALARSIPVVKTTESLLRDLRAREREIRARNMDEERRETLLERIRTRQYDVQRRAIERITRLRDQFE